MSASHVDVNAILDGLANRKMPRNVAIGTGVLMAVGAGAFAFGLMQDRAWAWGAYLAGLVFTLGIAQGSVIFSVIMTVTWARWARPLKRLTEAAGLYLLVGYVLLLVFLLFGNGIYSWNPDTFLPGGPVDLEPHGEWAIRTKPWWLSKGFFIGRQALGVGTLIALSVLYIRASLRPDLIQAQTFMRQKHPDWTAPGWWSFIIGGARPVDEEVERGQKTQATLAPIIGALYAFVFSFIAFDLIMSLAPWWYTNMFGAWFFASSFWISLAFTGTYALLSRDWLGITHLVTSRVTHDIGKLTLAFCMFWAYTFFAQLLPIWYANMPEETDFLLIRLYLPQWSWLARVCFVMCFLMPFTVLTSRGIKKMKWPFIGILTVIMTGIFLERSLLIMPSVYFGDTFPTQLFLTVSIPVGLGFVGALVFVTTYVLSKVPPIVVSDPRLNTHPWDVHVHALHERGEAHAK